MQPMRVVAHAGRIAAISVIASSCGGSAEAVVPDLPHDRSAGLIAFDDANRNGRLDDGEAPIANAPVTVTNPLTGQTTSRRTDDHGSLVVDAGALDSVTLSVRVDLPPPDGSEDEVPIRLNRVVHPGDVARVPVDIRELDCDDARRCDDLLLPDLVSLTTTPRWLPLDERASYPSPRRWRLDEETAAGRRLLRVATASANRGDGPLLILGTDRHGDDYRGTVQRLLTDDGGYLDVPAGTFELHSAHAHVHLENFERLRLRTDAGSSSADKISFCLTDVFSERRAALVPPVSLDFSLFDCGEQRQGINVGYADYYGPALPEQFVDVSDLPEDAAGRLTIVTDPDDVLVEKDESNNTAGFRVDLADPPDPDGLG